MQAPLATAPSPGAVANEPIWPFLAPPVFLLLWAGGFVVGKIGVAYAEPFTLLSIRYALVLVILLPLFAVMRTPMPATPAGWFHLVVVGLFIQAGYFCFVYAALSAGASAGTVALITSMQPILVALLAPALAGEGRVEALRWLGLLLGLAGAAIVILAQHSVAVASLVGVALAAASLLSMTAGTLWEKRFGVSHHPVSANLIQYAAALCVTSLLASGLESWRVDWSAELIWALAYLVLANSLLALTLLLAMLRRGEASRVSALLFLVPPVSAGLGWLMLDEQLPWFGWAGMFIAAAGVAISLRKSQPSPLNPGAIRLKP
jgi:drug/metabolite transporter (DMT)-like permease